MELAIEQLAPDDAQGLAQMLSIYRDAIEPSEQKTADTVANVLTDKRYIVLVARGEGGVRGFAILFVPPGDDFWLLEYIATSVRSQGLGGRLFQAAIGAAFDRNSHAVGVFEVDQSGGAVSEHNDQISRLRFYARLGCRRIEGLNYILPLETAGVPPPMMLLVHGLDGQTEVGRERVRGWLSTIYRDVYGCPADDPRIDAMLSLAGPGLQLAPINPA